jgi:hypothetical protein
MPIPMRNDEDAFFYGRADWKLVFALWPRRCDQSGKRIWLEYAYLGTRMITGPGDPVYLFRWVKSNEYLVAQLKGIIT